MNMITAAKEAALQEEYRLLSFGEYRDLRARVAELEATLHEARSVLIAWAANHESAVTQETIDTINEALK